VAHEKPYSDGWRHMVDSAPTMICNRYESLKLHQYRLYALQTI